MKARVNIVDGDCLSVSIDTGDLHGCSSERTLFLSTYDTEILASALYGALEELRDRPQKCTGIIGADGPECGVCSRYKCDCVGSEDYEVSG